MGTNIDKYNLTIDDRYKDRYIWATVEIYCLRQVRHQVSESPIVLQGFLFLHILTKFSLCLSIVLKRIHLHPHPWRSLFARVGATCAFAQILTESHIYIRLYKIDRYMIGSRYTDNWVDG